MCLCGNRPVSKSNVLYLCSSIINLANLRKQLFYHPSLCNDTRWYNAIDSIFSSSILLFSRTGQETWNFLFAYGCLLGINSQGIVTCQLLDERRLCEPQIILVTVKTGSFSLFYFTSFLCDNGMRKTNFFPRSLGGSGSPKQGRCPIGATVDSLGHSQSRYIGSHRFWERNSSRQREAREPQEEG